MPVDPLGNPRPRNAGDDLLDALGRLVAGRPRNGELLDRRRHGKLRINISTVSMEAGCSRTHLADKKNCAYPAVRGMVIAARKDSDAKARLGNAQRSSTSTVLKTLREQVDRLLEEKVIIKTKLAQAVALAKDLERQRDRAVEEARNARRIAQGRRPRPATPDKGAEVVPFPGR